LAKGVNPFLFGTNQKPQRLAWHARGTALARAAAL
jgi:hypothetical protein